MTTTPGSETEGYSTAYETLVKDADDVLGSVAYALYKGDKRAFVRDNNLDAADPRVRNYHKTALGEQGRKALCYRAGVLLNSHSSNAIEIYEKADGAILKELRARTKFWTAVGASLAATVLFAIILTIALFIKGQNPLQPWLENKTEKEPAGKSSEQAPAAIQPAS